MLEAVLEKAVEAAIGVAKDLFGGWIKEKNRELLNKKKESEKRRLVSYSELESLTLSTHEAVIGRLGVSMDQTLSSLQSHIDEIKTWSSNVGFRDLAGKKLLRDVYIDVNAYVLPVRTHFDAIEKEKTRALAELLLSKESHLVLLGQPGAGKTTAMQKLCLAFFNSTAGTNGYTLPLLIRLRELKPESENPHVLFSSLLRLLRVELEFQMKGLDYQESITQQTLLTLLEQMQCVVVLDGLDEIASAELREQVLADFRKLCSSLNRSKVVLTCRSGDFNYHVERAETFEIAPLSKIQIRLFAEKWIGANGEAEKFLTEVMRSPFADTAIRPLSLAHLCAIYQRIGKVPDQPKTIYRKIVMLLIEEWDEQRSIRRESKYAGFEADKKFEFLANLAYYFTTQKRSTVFSQEDFSEAYRRICENFSLSKEEERLVVLELESHTGLFIQAGYDKFEFAHKSLQEFLTAEYIVRLPFVPRDANVLSGIPNELAIAAAISSNPSFYLSELILNNFQKSGLNNHFFDVFINRLILEKPILYDHEELILAVHLLLALWVCEGKVSERKINVRRLNESALDKFKELKRFFGAVLIHDVIEKYYSTDYEEPIYSGETIIYKIKRRREHSVYLLPQYLILID